MLEFITKTVLAYLLGSVIGSLIVGKLRGGVDIRTQGSGNAGGTNALRTQGPLFAFWVMVIDIGKGWLAAGVLPGATLLIFVTDQQSTSPWLSIACAAAAVIGHVYPIWFGFRGGKGVACALGVFAAIDLPVALAVLVLCG